MSFTIEKIFAISLLSGFLYSLLLFISGGRLRFLRFGLKPKVRFPKIKLWKKSSSPIQDFAPPWLMPILIGTFLVIFGMVGLILTILFEISAFKSFVSALVISAISTTLVLAMSQRYLSDSATEIRGSALCGTLGHVCLTIPESGVGAIAYIQEGKRVTMPARSTEGHKITQGEQIVIVDLQGKIALVQHF